MATKTKAKKTIAVIDIGSNSVAMVIYRRADKKHHIIYKNKVTCGLARNLAHDRPRLDPKGVTLALQALRGFNAVLVRHSPDKTLAIGTAAMRAVAHTKKGKIFHRDAEHALGHNIKIISGKREAKLTAVGVMSALPKAHGVCGDLGGGSLELASVKRRCVHHATTLTLGSLTLISESGNVPRKIEVLIHERLSHVSWLKEAKGKTLYPTGGSWRAIARVIMQRLHIPSTHIHGFSVKTDVARKHIAAIVRQKPAVFRKMSKKIRNRADTIPVAAALLAEIIDRMQPRKITFSACGVREGLLEEN